MMDMNDPFAPIDRDAARDDARPHAEETWRPILPVPEDAPQLSNEILKRFAPEGFSLTGSWRYHDAEGRLLGHTARFDKPANGSRAEKEVKPFTFCQGPNGRREWRCKGFSEPRPLYGLDRLAARPDAPVLVVEGEKTADAAAKRFEDHVVITSPGGSNAARKADWSSVASRRVVIWPDADDPGARYADDVADMVRRAGAASVHVVKLPPVCLHGWDLADDLPAGLSDADLSELLTNAGPAASDGPIPLFPPLPPAERFPIEALGPVLSRAAQAIARKVQVPEAIAGQSVLAAAALAAQAHADVMLPYGQTRPLSLFLVTIAASGDRKSTADNEALWPIRKREKTLKEEHDSAYQAWSIASAAYNAEKRKNENDKKMDFEARKAALAALGPAPEQPLHPVPDGTRADDRGPGEGLGDGAGRAGHLHRRGRAVHRRTRHVSGQPTADRRRLFRDLGRPSDQAHSRARRRQPPLWPPALDAPHGAARGGGAVPVRSALAGSGAVVARAGRRAREHRRHAVLPRPVTRG